MDKTLGTGTPGATFDYPGYCDTGRPIAGEHVRCVRRNDGVPVT